ncbi:nuclear transport factor 2 family protein [Kitasatospora aureofaciens]
MHSALSTPGGRPRVLPAHPLHLLTADFEQQERTGRRSIMDISSSHRAIENLIAAYAVHVDSGDFGAVGALLADALFVGSGAPVRGREAVEAMFQDTLITYDDGTPRTKHVTTSTVIDIAADSTHATARSYFTVLQALPDLPLQPIAAGRYQDRFEYRGQRWHFTERHVHVDLVGNMTHHLRN